jgi:hypothetical protein
MILSTVLFTASLGLIKLTEINGDVTTTRDMVSMTIPQNGVVIVVPDRIFQSNFED